MKVFLDTNVIASATATGLTAYAKAWGIDPSNVGSGGAVYGSGGSPITHNTLGSPKRRRAKNETAGYDAPSTYRRDDLGRGAWRRALDMG